MLFNNTEWQSSGMTLKCLVHLSLENLSDPLTIRHGMEAIIQILAVSYNCSGKGRKKEGCFLRNSRSPFPGTKEFG